VSEIAVDPSPLTDREQAQLARLLGDPSFYPMVFKTWLRSFIETSPMVFPISTIAGLAPRLDFASRDPASNNLTIPLTAGTTLTIVDSTGAPIFRVDDDGDLHGKTGKAITFDL
jgi:hypothetical protein